MLASHWFKEVLEVENFSQIIFHLKFPVANAGGGWLVNDFLLKNILPAAIIALFFSCTSILKTIYAFLKKHKLAARAVLATLFLALALNIVVNKWRIKNYFKDRHNISLFYEEHYKPFDFAALEGFEPTQNLIVIFAEGLPSALSQHDPYSPLGDVAPKIGALALQHINFSTNGKMGGLQQMTGTGWTVAGIVGYLCGIPLNVPQNSFTPEYFLNAATCVPDVLNKLGYAQAYLSGTPQKLGAAEFFSVHHTTLWDLFYFQKENAVPNPIPKDLQSVSGWGINDRLTFELAKQKFQSLAKDAKPFALYISTIDTHGEATTVGTPSCPDMSRSLVNFFKCTDLLIADFVEFVAKSEVGKNTSIVILGDHLPRALFKQKVNEYGVFNAFINTPFEKNVDKTKSKYRFVTHFDMAPMLLESVGIKNDAFGLGRNPFEHPSLLESPFSEGTLNAELIRGNKMYDSFWQADKNPR